MSLPEINRVAIVGVGLIGGSFGMAVKKWRLAGNVIGLGRNPERLKLAVELGAVDEWSTDLESVVPDVDLVYVSTPVGMEHEFIRRSAAAAGQGCIITDAGSTKGEICRQADEAVPAGVRFVGGHPMSGSEAAGVEAAQPELFVNAAYVLTPTEGTDPEALAVIRRLAEGIGSRVIVMDPDEHDVCVAVISHLPHLIAAALASAAYSRSQTHPQMLELIAGSFRDMTRVAGSPPVLWRDICLTNADGIREAADSFRTLLDEGLRAIKSGDPGSVERWFERAREARAQTVRPDSRS